MTVPKKKKAWASPRPRGSWGLQEPANGESTVLSTRADPLPSSRMKRGLGIEKASCDDITDLAPAETAVRPCVCGTKDGPLIKDPRSSKT